MISRTLANFSSGTKRTKPRSCDSPEDNYWWCWYGSEIEANAYYLKLLARVEPRASRRRRLVSICSTTASTPRIGTHTRHGDLRRSLRRLHPCIRRSQARHGRRDLGRWQKRKEVPIKSENCSRSTTSLCLWALRSPTENTGRDPPPAPARFTTMPTSPTSRSRTRSPRLVWRSRSNEVLPPGASREDARAAGSRGQALDQKVEKFQRVLLANLSTVKSGQLVEIGLEIESNERLRVPDVLRT